MCLFANSGNFAFGSGSDLALGCRICLDSCFYSAFVVIFIWTFYLSLQINVQNKLDVCTVMTQNAEGYVLALTSVLEFGPQSYSCEELLLILPLIRHVISQIGVAPLIPSIIHHPCVIHPCVIHPCVIPRQRETPLFPIH